MNTDTTKPRCAIMVRGTEQEKARKIQDLRAVIESQGWQEVELIEESDDPGFAINRACYLARSKGIDRLMVHNITRIARKNSIVHLLVEQLTDLHVSLYWHSAGLETLLEDGRYNPAASMVLTLSISAEIESGLLADQPHWCDNMQQQPRK